MSNWQDMFDQRKNANVPLHTHSHIPTEPEDVDAPLFDPAIYQPWILQRGRGRPVMFIDLRRIEPKSGLVIGTQLSYPHLRSIDYIGDKMISLDFGTRHFVIEGRGLHELARFLQQGIVLAIQEYSAGAWPQPVDGVIVSRVVDVRTPAAETGKDECLGP